MTDEVRVVDRASSAIENDAGSFPLPHSEPHHAGIRATRENHFSFHQAPLVVFFADSAPDVHKFGGHRTRAAIPPKMGFEHLEVSEQFLLGFYQPKFSLFGFPHPPCTKSPRSTFPVLRYSSPAP